MKENTQIRSLLNVLEDYLVQEFRLLQSLIVITNEERKFLPGGDPDELMKLVERKENILDQMSLLEEKRRTVIEELGRELGVTPGTSSLGEILPWIEVATAGRLRRLSDGIAMLVGQARDLNYGNRALAVTAMDWLEATRAFIFGFYQNQATYSPPGPTPSTEQIPAWGVEHKA